MGDLLGNILNSVTSGGSANGALGDILGQVLGGQASQQVTKKPATTNKPTMRQPAQKGIDISKELDAINGVPASNGRNGGIDLGSVLGAATGKGGIDLGSILGGAAGKGGIDLGSVLGAASKGKGGLDLGTILGALLGGSQPSGGLAGDLSNANIGEIAQSVISVIGMASNAFGSAKQ